jgi:hypothetical protein
MRRGAVVQERYLCGKDGDEERGSRTREMPMWKVLGMRKGAVVQGLARLRRDAEGHHRVGERAAHVELERDVVHTLWVSSVVHGTRLHPVLHHVVTHRQTDGVMCERASSSASKCVSVRARVVYTRDCLRVNCSLHECGVNGLSRGCACHAKRQRLDNTSALCCDTMLVRAWKGRA